MKLHFGQKIADHFVDVNKMIPMPKTATKEIEDILKKSRGNIIE